MLDNHMLNVTDMHSGFKGRESDQNGYIFSVRQRETHRHNLLSLTPVPNAPLI